jgi:hypothetical protein
MCINYMNEFTVRNIETSDYTKNYLQLLEQHFNIDVHTLLYDDFTEYVANLNTYHQVFVIENNNKNTTVIIGSVTIFY